MKNNHQIKIFPSHDRSNSLTNDFLKLTHQKRFLANEQGGRAPQNISALIKRLPNKRAQCAPECTAWGFHLATQTFLEYVHLALITENHQVRMLDFHSGFIS